MADSQPGHGGSLFNGESHILYWADVSSEIAFVVPTAQRKAKHFNDFHHHDPGEYLSSRYASDKFCVVNM